MADSSGGAPGGFAPKVLAASMLMACQAGVAAEPAEGGWRGHHQPARASVAEPVQKIPLRTLVLLKNTTGLDGEQWDNIMKLISQRQRGTLDWYRFYGHCVDTGDARGLSIGPFGATTGGPGEFAPEAPILFREYDAVSGARHPSVAGGLARVGLQGAMRGTVLEIAEAKDLFCWKVNRLQNNVAWREAMWRIFLRNTIQESVGQARQRGFRSALTVGAFVDTALLRSGRVRLRGLLARMGPLRDESAFMRRFLNLRAANVARPSGGGKVWRALLQRGETDLKNADEAVCFASRQGWTGPDRKGKFSRRLP